MFELAHHPDGSNSFLIEFVKPGEAERACQLINRMVYNGRILACNLTERSRECSGTWPP